MQSTAQSWLVYDLSNDVRYLGWDRFLGEIPIVLLSLFGGVLADRVNRRYILLGSQLLQMVCALVLTALLVTGYISKSAPRVWPILCISFFVGIAQAFGGPAYSALVPSLVDKEHLPNAISLNSIQFNLARVIGPTLGGIALTKLGAQWCFGLNALSYVAVIISLMVVRPMFVPKRSSERVFESMKKGINFIREREAMVPLIALSFLMTFLSVSILQFLPEFVKKTLHADTNAFTGLLVASGLGSVCGALMVAAFAKRKGIGRLSLFVLMFLGVVIGCFSLVRWLPLSLFFMFLGGGALIGVFAMVMSMVQTIVTDDMRGRVMSVYNLALRGGFPIGALTAGYLIPSLTLPVVLLIDGVGLVILAGYFLLFSRKVATL
jgi:predicted MFS family arabinose efflux permease